MADLPAPGVPARGWRLPRLQKLIASRGFQSWAARFPLTRRRVRREGEALFDLVAGFCHSQVLMALVQLDLPQTLLAGPKRLSDLSRATAVPEARLLVLLQAAAALGLVRQGRRGAWGLTHRGAALAGVPGLQEMIRHHDLLYRDLGDPAAFFRGETVPELADFWPYVFGGAVPPERAETYSRLMADSQRLVAEDTLATLNFRGISHLMDVGGGTGAFLAAVSQAWPDMDLTLFDLPQVVPAARARFAAAGLSERVTITEGSFRTGALPRGADAISLVRVLYDHEESTVAALLGRCYEALPPGGRLIISEPMSGGRKPERAGDAYFALYTLAMGTGKARSAAEIGALCRAAGFRQVRAPKPRRAFVTSCLEARKPG